MAGLGPHSRQKSPHLSPTQWLACPSVPVLTEACGSGRAQSPDSLQVTDGVLLPRFPVLKMKELLKCTGGPQASTVTEGEVTSLPGGHLSLLGAPGARAESIGKPLTRVAGIWKTLD